MREKIGRNDPCYCGSGKKYKKCCIVNETSDRPAEVLDLAWRKLRQLEGAVLDQHLIPYVTKTLPNEVMMSAIEDGLPEMMSDDMDNETLFNCFFLPWALFNWIPFEDFGLSGFDPDKTLSENYVLSYGQSLNSRERRFIDAMNKTYYSFYSIERVEEDKALYVKDMLLGTEHTIKERQGTHVLKRGGVVFSRILTLDNQSIFVGMAPFTVPPRYRMGLVDFKQWLIDENEGEPLTPQVLRDEMDYVLLEYYFDILEDASEMKIPTLVNTDDELVQPTKSYFKLTLTPEEALNKLLPMTLSNDLNEFIADAKRDKSDAIIEIVIPWLREGNSKHKSLDNTLLGHVLINKDKLTLDTNSQERTERGKKFLEKLLGKNITFQQSVIESTEQLIKSLPSSGTGLPSQEDLMAMPEVQEKLDEMAKAHWENWFDEPIPMLDNQTPREAAKTENGKERLEALLMDYEAKDALSSDNLFKADVSFLRKMLELT